MIKLGSTIKVTDTTQYHDPQLSLQTAPAYFLIRRQIPSSTILPVFSTQPPIMDNPSNGQNSFNEPGSQGLPKSVLEYIFLALVVFIIFCIIFRRYRTRVRRRQQVVFQPSASRRYCSYPRSVELRSLHPDGQPYPAYPDPFLREVPAAYMGQPPSRRTRAPDIDSRGRRQDTTPTERDHDGNLGAKDILPPYDNFGGPPKYFELDMPNRPPLSGINHRSDVSWENITNTSPENVGTTHAAQVSRPNTSRPIPPYLENTSSNNSVPTTRPRHETYRD